MPESRSKGQDRSGSRWVKSSGNVFRDLGFSEEESASLLVRADLMIAITRIIDKRGWTPAEAAGALGVKQPRISELRKGKIEKFSVDLLLRYLARLGKRVDFKVSDTHRVA